MSVLRLLLPGTAVVGDLDADRDGAVQALADLYAYPDPLPAGGWVRANMVSTLDGAAAGPDGRSGTIGDRVDRLVLSTLRGLADVVLVGAGTARAEGYGPPRQNRHLVERRADRGQPPAAPLAVMTRSGRMPDATGLFDHGNAAGTYAVTTAAADLARLEALAGRDHVLVAGDVDVDLPAAVRLLSERGLRRILLEGGPTVLADTVAAGRLDELCLTLSPIMVAGGAPRIAAGPPGWLRLRPAHLIESDGVLLGRWLVRPE